MTNRIPIVDYLKLDDPPNLTAHECVSCGAHFFDRRNACASCSAVEFTSVDVAPEGTLETFTIVAQAAPGIPVPFVAGVVKCAGITVRGNVINTPADPDHVKTGMKLRLATYVAGTDSEGTDVIGFGFESVDE